MVIGIPAGKVSLKSCTTGAAWPIGQRILEVQSAIDSTECFICGGSEIFLYPTSNALRLLALQLLRRPAGLPIIWRIIQLGAFRCAADSLWTQTMIS